MKDSRKVLFFAIAIALVLSVLGITVGFAAMSSQLKITGTTSMTPASWKIKFNNLSQSALVGTAEVVTAPSIQSDTHIGNYAVNLSKPGDTVVYTFDVVNSGTIDAEITTYLFATPTITGTGEKALADAQIVSDNLIYTLTYADGTSIQKGDVLAKDATASLKLTVGYDSEATELPENEVSITGMDVTFVYGQK